MAFPAPIVKVVGFVVVLLNEPDPLNVQLTKVFVYPVIEDGVAVNSLVVP